MKKSASSLGDVFLDRHISNQKGPENGGIHDLIEGNMFPNPKKYEEKLRKRLWYQQQLLIFRGRFWCLLFFILFKHAFQPPARETCFRMRQKKHLSSLCRLSGPHDSVSNKKRASGVEGWGEHPESHRIQRMVYLPFFTYIYHKNQVNLGEFTINTWMVWVWLLQD